MIDVVKPTLLLNQEKSVNNIKNILQNIKYSKINIRPHFKTHQSLEVGRWFKKLGIQKITVSSVSMAKYFSDQWDDITIAFPINILEIEDVITLQKKINVNLLIDSLESLKFLEGLDEKFSLFIKVNVGYNRAGIDYDDDEINQIIEYASKSTKIKINGFLSHFGNTYLSKSKEEIESIFDSSLQKISYLNKKYKDFEVSIGDTPSASLVKNYPNFITEVRPGNFIFYDLDQFKIGSCKLDQVAIRLVCPVVSIYDKRNSLLLYGGSVHFSKDYIIENDKKCYGYVYCGDYWSLDSKVGYIKSLSQEHGVVEIENNKNLKVGDKLSVIPVHSCLAVDKMKEFYVGDKKFKTMN